MGTGSRSSNINNNSTLPVRVRSTITMVGSIKGSGVAGSMGRNTVVGSGYRMVRVYKKGWARTGLVLFSPQAISSGRGN